MQNTQELKKEIERRYSLVTSLDHRPLKVTFLKVAVDENSKM